MDSPFAIFEYLLNEKADGRNRFEFVWSVRSTDVVPVDYRDRADITYVKRHTPNYFYYLTRAKYIVGNSTFPEYFMRRSDQQYLNTRHGIGFKSLGRSEVSPLRAQQAVYNMFQATHVVSPFPFMTEVHERGFSMRGVHAGNIAEVGYPRIDLTLNCSKADQQMISEDLGLDPGKQTVLYAPTWCGDGFDVDRLSEDLVSLSKLDANVVFMGHHLMLKHMKGMQLDDVIVPRAETNTNRLLAVVDVLITDYSSIFFDVLRTGARIIHYVYDFEEYDASRGLSLSLEELPGVVVRQSSDLIQATQTALASSRGPKYYSLLDRFSPYEHGESSEAVVRWFFDGDASTVKVVSSTRRSPRVIFWGGRMDSTEDTEAFLADLVSTVEEGKSEVSLLVARSVSSLPRVMETLAHLGGSVSVITRGSYPFAMTSDEERARASLSVASLPESREQYADIYRREYRRIFGDSRFDAVVMHPRLSRFWKELAKYAAK